MRKFLLTFLVLAFVGIFIGITLYNAEAGDCTTVKDRALSYSPGHYLESLQPIKPGFDPFGYNYQAHLFNGYYANAYLGKDGFPPYEGDDAAYLQRLLDELYTPAQIALVQTNWYWPYRDVILNMKWNDAWLSNKDCNEDEKLDRCSDPGKTCIGSGALDTNHQSGTYVLDGKECHWNYFVKIVAAPVGATPIDGVWYTADGKEIGPVIWGSYATIQQVYNDPCAGYHGIEYLSPAGPGFGKWKE